jgi:hypothetical protein
VHPVAVVIAAAPPRLLRFWQTETEEARPVVCSARVESTRFAFPRQLRAGLEPVSTFVGRRAGEGEAAYQTGARFVKRIEKRGKL